MELIYVKKGTGLVSVDFQTYKLLQETFSSSLQDVSMPLNSMNRIPWSTKISFFSWECCCPPLMTLPAMTIFRRCIQRQISLPDHLNPLSTIIQKMSACLDQADRLCDLRACKPTLWLSKGCCFNCFFSCFHTPFVSHQATWTTILWKRPS